MRKFLIIVTFGSWVLFRILCDGFDASQVAGKAAVERVESEVNEAGR